MLERIKIQNFGCLRDVEVSLRPLTVLIGPNDTGKSTFIAAVSVLCSRVRPEKQNHWRCSEENAIHIVANGNKHELVFGQHAGARPPGTYAVSLDGRVLSDPELEALGDPLAGPRKRTHAEPARVYEILGGPLGYVRLPSAGPAMRSPGISDQGPAPKLGDRGEGVPALLDYLLRRDRARFHGVVQAMRARVPGLEDINVSTPDLNTRRVDLLTDSGLELPADAASAGVRIMLFFMTLTFHPSPPGLILLEEPENSVHPKRLADIVQTLRDITKGVHCGHPAQVILATHSPYLLDHVNLDEDQVLVFRRNDDGSRTAEPVDSQRLKAFLDDFMLGEVWFNEGEEGLVKREG